jgi:hypothetical protein
MQVTCIRLTPAMAKKYALRLIINSQSLGSVRPENATAKRRNFLWISPLYRLH